MNALEWNEGLNLAAKEHCDDLGPKGLQGHFGTDESSPFDRISKYGKPGWWRGENLTFRGKPLSGMTKEEADKEALRIVLAQRWVPPAIQQGTWHTKADALLHIKNALTLATADLDTKAAITKAVTSRLQICKTTAITEAARERTCATRLLKCEVPTLD